MEKNKCQNYQNVNVKDADTNGFLELKILNGALVAEAPIGIEKENKTERAKRLHRIACKKHYYNRIAKGLSGNHHLNTICPLCGKPKDDRAIKCKLCRNKLNRPRQGTGKHLPRYCNEYKLIYLPNHPYSDDEGYYPEHRYIVEQNIGRVLDPSEIVHHRDKNRANNEYINLQLTTQSEHTRNHNLIRYHGKADWKIDMDKERTNATQIL